jgi:hypothetical protein
MSDQLHTCPDCKNGFHQPFKCITCGAEKLYDATLRSLQAENAALRAEVEKWKACRVHDVEEKEWLRDQMIALRAVLREYVKMYPANRQYMRFRYVGSPEHSSVPLEDRARALLTEGKA